MELFILKPIEGVEDWEPWYDKSFGHIVRAENEKDAREIASNHCGKEGEEPWLNGKKSTCEKLSDNGSADCLMTDFARA